MKQMHSKEFDALLQMPAPDRYALFIRRVADLKKFGVSVRLTAGVLYLMTMAFKRFPFGLTSNSPMRASTRWKKKLPLKFHCKNG